MHQLKDRLVEWTKQIIKLYAIHNNLILTIFIRWDKSKRMETDKPCKHYKRKQE